MFNRILVKILVYSLPGLLFAIWWDYILARYSDLLALSRKFDLNQNYGIFFPANPYIYHLGGLYLGLILCFVLIGSKCQIGSRIWPVFLVVSGITILFLKDMFLVITVFSFGPGIALYELHAREDNSQNGPENQYVTKPSTSENHS